MMKRITNLITITAIILGLAACSGHSTVIITTLPSASAPAPASQAPLRTPGATPTEAALQTPTATPAPTASPSPAKDNTVIIATSYGNICGGYSKGKWLNDSEAAELCKGKITFSRYSLTELKETVKSAGATYEQEDYESIGGFYLKLPEAYYAEIGAEPYFENEPLSSAYLYSGGKLPVINVVSDTTDINSAVQDLLNEKMGEEAAEAEISVAVKSDIDNDGKKETVVNADGGEDYCLCCIIESNGTVKVIEDYYFIPTDEMPDSDYRLIFVQNIIDIDGDGMSELLVEEAWGEDSGTTVYKYNGKSVSKVIEHWVYEECP